MNSDTILLVDDDPAVLLTVGDRLRLEGYNVTTSASGEEALQVLRSMTPDLIILDISMPGMTGLGFLKKISSADGRSRYPVLVFTARSNMERFFADISVEGFLTKTSDPSLLLQQVRQILEKTKRPAQPMAAAKGRRHLLILEDEPQLAARLRSFFHAAGYDTVITSCNSIMEETVARKPDGILIKEILPNTKGHAVAALLGESPATRQVPVIVYDGSGILKPDVKFPLVDRVVTSDKPADLLKAVSGLVSTGTQAL